jgi:ribosomal protein S18 acetylase RimI-like enzyme
MSAVFVRDATAADLAAVAALTAEWDAEDPGPTPASRGEIDARDVLAPGGSCATLVAEKGGAVVAFLLHARSYDLWSRTHGAHLLEVYVARDARRGGVARALLAELARRTLADGGRWIAWTMARENAAGHAFYDALGARRRPEIEFRALSGAAVRRLGGQEA